MAKWTADNMPEQNGKIVIITGANSGIGHVMARELARKNAQVIMACRSMDKGNGARETIIKEVPAASLEVMPLDLASLDSVRQFAEQFKAQYEKLDVLINNAGVMALPQHDKTADGFEMQFGTNHLGHFALTGLLLNRLTDNARVVTVSSSAHRMGKIDFDNLNAEKSYSRWPAYGQSKLANLLFAYELQHQLDKAQPEKKILSLGMHPGWSATNLQAHVGIFQLLNHIVAQSADMGALPALYAATMPDVTETGYYGPDGFGGMRGYPKKVSSSSASHDEKVAAQLWEDLKN